MNENRIKKLRWKFVIVSFCSLSISMLLITGLLSGANYYLVRKNIHNTLQYIVDNDGYLPGSMDQKEEFIPIQNHSRYDVIRFLNEIFNMESYEDTDNPEFYYRTRYFAIIYDDELEISKVITNHIAAVSAEEAKIYGAIALDRKLSFGRYEEYYFKVAELETGETIVVYLDSSDIIMGNSRILYLAMSLIMIGIVLAAVITSIFSKWAIAPEIKNMELQKRFITNASHELKTPLAVIRANTEMMEMLNGETEWSASTMRQVDRLNGLIQNLVTIVKAEESFASSDISDCNITAVVQDTVETFSSIAETEGKKITRMIQENVVMSASDDQIRQLCSLLLDNAIKYCDDKGTIQVGLCSKGKGIQLSVSNDYKDGENKDYSRFFERFYREDQSHNTDKGGYGIGLSIVESIVSQYHGTVSVNWKGGIITFNCILKPLVK